MEQLVENIIFLELQYKLINILEMLTPLMKERLSR